MALSVEAAELMEYFQWLSEAQSHDLDVATTEKVRDEIADVQIYLAMLAYKLDIDIFAAVSEKIEKNNEKYPVDKVYGSAKKYNEYQ